MIVNIEVSIRATHFNIGDGPARQNTEIEIDPQHLDCLDVGKLAEELAARAIVEYLAWRAEADEQEVGE